MSDTPRDLRKIGGTRVMAAFTLVVDNPNPFSPVEERFFGTIVFNVRGGCLFIDNAGPLKAYQRIFSEGPVTTLKTLELTSQNLPPFTINKIKLKEARQKEVNGADGLVFKFFQITEEHIDTLNDLVTKLPPAGSDQDVINSLKSA